MLPVRMAAADDGDHWVGTWATAPQLVESHNNPPSPGLKNNTLRQIFEVSIGGDSIRLKLSNEFSTSSTEILGVEIAYAQTAGSQPTIDEGSTISLSFDGKSSVTMAAGKKATSDPIAFHLEPRQNVAVTLHYGSASSTSVTGHPGSRTTSYLKSGSTTDFSQAVKTEHWYSILALEVKAPASSGCVAILGNSITDGRGSTTNQQNRWPDVLSKRLLDHPETSQVGVLNMGIGGNCMLNGGLGPTGSNRWQRDLLEQEGVKWIILFEAVNDLGSAANGQQTAQQIIEVYKQIIRAAHQKNIYVFGATITPFKGNNYYSTDHEKGRRTLNTWIRNTPMLDGVIDFDKAVRNPSDTLALQNQYLFENDHLHLNASGYEAMGNAIDLNLFTKTGPVATDEDTPINDGNTFSSNLPLVYIHTSATINSDAKVPGTMQIIDNPEGQRNYANDTVYDYNGCIGIKLRGNSSLSFAQKKYTLETWDAEGNDIKASLLGMPTESDWVLLAPYNDLSLVRDVFAYNMWTEMGHWGPRNRMCEVFVNDEYMGIYVFCEKIKRDKNRVDIANLKTDDVADRELTGGYIVRVDAFDEQDVTFRSKVPGLQSGMWGGSGTGTVTWTIYYPKKEDLKDEQKAYIQNFVDQMEQSFQQTNYRDTTEGYAKWIDVPSFVDYFIHTELSLNADGYKRSSYFCKDKDASDGTVTRMEAGPVWDYNLAYGDCNFCNANNPQAWVYEGCETNPTPALWKKLTQDPAFMEKVRARYAQLRNTIISTREINAFFDDYSALLNEAQQRHYEKYDDLFQSNNSGGGWSWWGWGGQTSPISYFAAYYVESYDEEIQTVKEWFAKRLAFLDSQWGYDESQSIRTLTDDDYFDVQMSRDMDGLSVSTNRALQSMEVYSLTGHLLQAVTADKGCSSLSLSLPRAQHDQPIIVICQARNGAYITRKLR